MRTLRAGPLTMEFQDGDIRGVRYGRREVLQRIYVAIRDCKWGTISNRISNLTIDERSDSFDIRYDAENQEGDTHFRWAASISGFATGEIRFSMIGAAVTSFLRNRIGICVLHPAGECAGRPCRVETTDDRVEAGEFPYFVAPHQPFRNIRAITHEIEPGVSAEVRFSGDVFEMEDQRNWTDYSFKTYSTPLALPFPVRVNAGTEVRQSVCVNVRGATRPECAGEGDVEIELLPETVSLPPLGLGGAGTVALDLATATELARLHLAHLRLDIPPANIAEALELADSNARALGLGLECFIPAGADLREVAEACARIRPRIVRWLLDGESMEAARRHLGPVCQGACFAAGSASNFAELNRKRPDPAVCDAMWFAVNPQVHSFDDRSLVENLRGQAAAEESAHRFAGGRPVFVSPVTLRPATDPRQRTWFAAAWTLGSIRYLAGAGAGGVTYYEMCGARGVIGFPVFDLLVKLAEFAGGEVVLSTSSDPLTVEALALKRDGRCALMLANFTGLPRRVHVAGRTIEANPTGVTAVDLT